MTTQQINSKKIKNFVNFEIFAVGEPGSNVGIFSWFLFFWLCLLKRTLLQTYKTKKKQNFFCLFLSLLNAHTRTYFDTVAHALSLMLLYNS